MSFRDRIRDLAAEAQREVVNLFDRWQRGDLTESQFVSAVATVLASANARGVRTADRSAALQIARQLRREVDPVAEPVPDDRPKLRDAVTTLLAERPEIAVTPALLVASQRDRLQRLARSEPLRNAQRRFQKNLDAQEMGWTRAIGPDACPLCREWDDGQVRPASVPMPHHPGCSCTQVPAPL